LNVEQHREIEIEYRTYLGLFNHSQKSPPAYNLHDQIIYTK